ncbi:ABC transporter ATP-binding protein [Saccharibacillus sp. CPCC 101409]|uniref:ABC transporter ATP-binding protein n=1 Tax=Saccharibacillus sp. CPCC 101409 TaxID=3058041 RepID=UPI002671247B|nr:ABC transporter ATP-binding protein [Saccharibacillus sp. CPCC 101409]MDO3411164.1 ABC transporter ATP-binding protein [Saccharibacillus sp. CPCC 101409]
MDFSNPRFSKRKSSKQRSSNGKFPVKKFLSYYRPHLKLFTAVLVCAAIVSAASLALPLLVRQLTKETLANGNAFAIGEAVRIGTAMLALILIQNAGGYFVDYKGHEVGARMERDIRGELFAHMQTLSFDFHDRRRTGELMSRLTHDLLLLSELYHHGPEDYLKYSVRFVGAFIILFTIDAPLTLTVFAFLPVLGLLTLVFNKKLNRTLTHNKERIAGVNEQAEDSLAGIRVVQSFGGEKLENGKFGQANERFFRSRKATYRAEALFYNTFETVLQLITVAAVLVGSVRIAGSRLDLADLIAFLLYIGYLTEPVQRLAHMSSQLQEGVTGFQRFMEIMRTVPSVEDRPDARRLERAAGGIEFRGVSFRYDSRESETLNELSLHIRAGEYVALVGPSGSGKTTLCSLIPRFYDVQGGAVLLDGRDVREWTLESLRGAVGTVQQDVYLFGGTVEDNIRYGRPDADEAQIVEAARQAGAHEFIAGLPQGYRTEIGQRGVRLSGGQKQRLSIARLFLKNPPVLILDEATSALDNESEAAVREALDRLAVGRTTLVVAHRLSTIRGASRIVVLTERGITEQGAHDELLARGGIYAELYAKSFI